LKKLQWAFRAQIDTEPFEEVRGTISFELISKASKR